MLMAEDRRPDRDRHGEGTARAAKGTYIPVSMGADQRPSPVLAGEISRG
jgi:hypothetical protein